MRRIGLYFLILTTLTPSRAQETPSGKVHVTGFVPAVPSSGPRAEFLEAAAYYEQRRPQFRSEDHHGAGPRQVKTPAVPEGFLRSFRKTILMLDDMDADKPQKMFNRQTTL